MITSTLLRSALSRNVRCSHHVRQIQSIAHSSTLDSDLSSDDTSPLLDKRIMNHLPEYNPSDLHAQMLRSRLPPQMKLNELGAEVCVPKREMRTMPRMEVDVEDVPSIARARPLPSKVHDLSNLDEDARAIVVTETKSPFRVTNVNSSWEALCGYQREECKGRSLGSLLNGPETDKMAATALVSKLLSGEEAGVILTNYTKSGRKFKNYVRVGPVVDEMGKTVNFVGVLKEVVDAENVMSAHDDNTMPIHPKFGATKLPFMS